MAKEKEAKKLSAYECAVFCDQLAMLLNSGITVSEGVYMLSRDIEDRRIKNILDQLHEATEANITLNEAMVQAKAFPEYLVHMTAVGEETGRLEEVMRALSEYYERESRVRAEQRSAIAYPVVLFSIMTVIISVLAWMILPMFEQMFLELGDDIASTTWNVMNIGLAAGRIIAILTGALLLFVIVMLLYGRTKRGARLMQRLSAGIGMTRKASRLMAVGKFISSMALMTASGMDPNDALENEAEFCEDKEVAQQIAACLKFHRDGKQLDEAFRDSGLLVGMEAGVISVAVKAGELDSALARLREQYNEKISEALSKISSRIETVLVVTLSLLVGAVLLCVMLPLVSMISSIG